MVTLSLAKPLVSQFVLDGKIQKVEYEGLPVICFTCGRYGHSSNSCKDSSSVNNPGEDAQPNPNMQPQETPCQRDDHCNDANNAKPFGPWMIATRRGQKFNNHKDNNNGVNRNYENIGAGFSRFQILDQVIDDSVNPTHAAMKYNPSTSHQPTIMANLNPIFNANREDRTITPARRKQHTTAVTTKLQRKTPTAPINQTRNPFPQSALTIREENTNYPLHANPQITAGLNP